MLEQPATWFCPACGEASFTLVDPSAGTRQQYVEDCQVCCRPAILTITIDHSGEVWIEAEPE
ncbi:MAG TPA: CPXCG motif-containing cysteine-rich protein [Blastocatellia bacterium]|nr:CPXCG motif-containing cysteine-rich protein [Blastocatellia bacterium]